MEITNSQGKKRLKEVLTIAQGSMSRRAFSRSLGVSPTAVILWEQGETAPDLANLIKIAKLSGYSLEELVCYLSGESLPEPDLFDKMLREINQMPLEQVVKLTCAGINRLEKFFKV